MSQSFLPSFFALDTIFGSVHDGWGVAQEKGIEGNAIEAATTTNMDTIAKDHSYRTLLASGTSVGLSEGLMGNSEVGYVLVNLQLSIFNRPSFFNDDVYIRHLNIGAGRVVWQDIVRIDVAIKKKQFHKNPALLASCKRAKEGNGRLHALGLVCVLIYDLFVVLLSQPDIRWRSALPYQSSVCPS